MDLPATMDQSSLGVDSLNYERDIIPSRENLHMRISWLSAALDFW